MARLSSAPSSLANLVVHRSNANAPSSSASYAASSSSSGSEPTA